jgi:ribosomal protein S18 acetylase RimI-like enzyme
MTIFKEIKINDYQKLIQFWKANYFIRGIDSLKYFKLFLEKNPNLSILAEKNGEIIGTVLGSFDGRRGYIQKLVVHKDFRGKGIGKELIKRVTKKLQKAGALYIPISCKEKNIPFYTKSGFKKTGKTTMSKEK